MRLLLVAFALCTAQINAQDISSCRQATLRCSFKRTFCSAELVESIPVGLTYPDGSFMPKHSTFQAWLSMMSTAARSLDMTAFYWSLMGGGENGQDPSDWEVRIETLVALDKNFVNTRRNVWTVRKWH